MTYDVAVVGAGPAGLICAAELEKLGEKPIVIEKSSKVGEPVACAGLFSIDGMNRLKIPEGDYILNKVKGAQFICSTGDSSEIRGKGDKAYVVDRGEFDRFLASRYGGELMLGKEVMGVKKKGDAYVLDTSGKSIEANNVVLATGCDQGLHESLGFKGPGTFISTGQYEIEGVNIDPDFVELYLGSVAPGFFAWIIPINKTRVRIGLGTLGAGENTHQYIEKFLKRLKDEGRFKEKNQTVQRSGGLIPLFEPTVVISKENAYLVGDAAGQVKATTGGGVMLGGLAAKVLARAIHDGTNYAQGLREIAGELNNHLLIRNVINKLGDEQFGHMVEFMNKPEVKKAVEEYGDMDMVTPLIKVVMKNPKLLMEAMQFMGSESLL